MQSPISPTGWARLWDGLVGGSLVAALVALLNWFSNRKRPAAEIHLTERQADKVEAERESTAVETALKIARELQGYQKEL